MQTRRPSPRRVALGTLEPRTALTKQPGNAFTLNPFHGCPVSCAYCYVPRLAHMRHETRPWGSYLDVKQGLAEKLDLELGRLREPAEVMMSTATDPYVPQEQELGLTRSLLEVFARHPRHALRILTKTTLYLRDLDLLSRLPRVAVGCSISTFKDALAAAIEPWAALPSERLEALRVAAESGVRAYVLWAPMIVPADADRGAYRLLLSAIGGRGVRAVVTDRANYRDTFSEGLLARIAREGERFATARDEDLVAGLRDELGLRAHALPPAAPEGEGAQLSLFS